MNGPQTPWERVTHLQQTIRRTGSTCGGRKTTSDEDEQAKKIFSQAGASPTLVGAKYLNHRGPTNSGAAGRRVTPRRVDRTRLAAARRTMRGMEEMASTDDTITTMTISKLRLRELVVVVVLLLS